MQRYQVKVVINEHNVTLVQTAEIKEKILYLFFSLYFEKEYSCDLHGGAGNLVMSTCLMTKSSQF